MVRFKSVTSALVLAFRAEIRVPPSARMKLRNAVGSSAGWADKITPDVALLSRSEMYWAWSDHVRNFGVCSTVGVIAYIGAGVGEDRHAIDAGKRCHLRPSGSGCAGADYRGARNARCCLSG